jgi:hypothetical protein
VVVMCGPGCGTAILRGRTGGELMQERSPEASLASSFSTENPQILSWRVAVSNPRPGSASVARR